jgi:hypothetical protein
MARVLSADLYDKPKAREYGELMDAIEGRGRFGEDVYGALMQKEGRVLDTVDRVINDARLRKSSSRLFTNLPLKNVAFNTARVVQAVYRDLLRVRTLRQFQEVFTPLKRRIYLGVVLVCLAVFIMVVQVSS